MLIETCKINGVDPQAYMADLLTKSVDGHLTSKRDDRMPWAYAQPVALKDVAWKRRLRRKRPLSQ